MSRAEEDKELKLTVEAKLAATEACVRQDTAMLKCVQKERDELHQTIGHLRSEHMSALDEREQAR